jgi:hypothetical protein
VKSPICVAVRAKFAPFTVHLPGVFQVGLQALGIVVGVNEVVAGVVRRVNVDHLHFAEVGFLQQLKHFQVVPFNDQVFGRVEVDAFFQAWQQRPGAWA